MRKIGVLVLGTYRSGTSALAGVLHNLGFNADPKTNGPDQFNSTGSFVDKYLEFVGPAFTWNDYFIARNAHENWTCKSHAFIFRPDLLTGYKNNFPADREPWLFVTDRTPDNSHESFNTVSGRAIPKEFFQQQKQFCLSAYTEWTGRKELISFQSLITDTEYTVKHICDILGAPYSAEAHAFVSANLSQFGV